MTERRERKESKQVGNKRASQEGLGHLLLVLPMYGLHSEEKEQKKQEARSASPGKGVL